MTAGTHTQYNYNRRNSATSSPYTIPVKHQHGHRSHQYATSPIQSNQFTSSSHGRGSISSSGPTLSREFVVRRISEGESGRLKEELKCEACGKGYKHISSLAKHLWEHTPEWNVTKKLLISKHQQVQLLEAASILVGMNDGATSRRNSVFHEEEDPKYSSPLSPSFPGENGSTSKVPTPPSNSEPEKLNENYHTFKYAYGGAYEVANVPSEHFSRSRSVSHYSHDSISEIGSPISGGFLEGAHQSLKETGVKSIDISNGSNNGDTLKSPPSSYNYNSNIPAQETKFIPTSKSINCIDENVDDDAEHLDNKSLPSQSSEDEEVLGKME
ncbi:uncharacterized protein PRCAT00005587001 [Priceomyces carsonii]|uniref:uncharacterized protein n=1 Tax=Priceomyces carsonii TaxID=28549 RepID=UPI002ED94E44|nr:unnamed protein product [Priceomyces carsonii]